MSLITSNIHSKNSLVDAVAKWKAEGKKIVFTNGCFDLLHLGHLETLQEAKNLGDILVVGINSDASVERLKGSSRPIKDEETRSILLSNLRCVDAVVLFEEDTPLQLISSIVPDVLVKGGDWKIEEIVGAEIVSKNKGLVITVPYLEGNSTTNYIQKLKSNKFMNFELTEEQLAVQAAARNFAQNECKPGVIDRDTHMTHPTELLKEMGQLGFMGMMVDPKYKGGGMDTLSYVIALEELSKVDNSCSVAMSVNNSLVCWGLEAFGTEAQKEKYLKPLASGEIMGAFCLSEPEAGSDATMQRTTAEDKGDHYLVNGTKNWITNGGKASVYLVIAQTDVSKGHRGINALIVEKDMEGFVIGAKEDKLGIRSSDTHSLMFTNVKVPKENRIGEDGFGFKFAMKTLSGGRIGIAAQALGIAQGAYELSVTYSQEREAFGKPIANHQAIAFKLADMATEIEAARLLVYKAAYLKDIGEDYSTASAMAKVYASEVAMKHTVEAVQIHGGYGYVKEYHVERLMRDAKITQIYEGTSEIQRIVISRNLLK